uniref:Vacuolar iron transporter n=1 Tax=Aegilops tauschii TaxID=37682 RepID=R7VYX4_AEGTA
MCGDVDNSESSIDFAGRANWLRAAVLGANDGLVSTASLMLDVSAIKPDARAMVVSGFAGLLAGACSMAIGESGSVCPQRDGEIAQLDRDGKRGGNEEKGLPSPAQAAAASALAFSVGSLWWSPWRRWHWQRSDAWAPCSCGPPWGGRARGWWWEGWPLWPSPLGS